MGAAYAKQVKLQKTIRNNVFRGKQATKKITLIIFRALEVRKKVRLIIWTPEDTMKGKCYVFSGYKKKNKVCLVDVECKLQEDSYCYSIFTLKF